MNYLENSFPVPSDYFGVLWALAGVKDSKVVEHGSTGTVAYNNVNFGILNRLKPKGILFSSGLDEDDVVMGREEKLIAAVKEVDRLYSPKLISIAATGVTSVIGLDLEGIAVELEKEINAKLITFSGGGFSGSYLHGIEQVLSTLAREIVKEPRKKKPLSVNLIGTTVDSFNFVSDIEEIKRILSLFGIEINTVFTQNTDFEHIEYMSEAVLNIVTCDTGIKASQILKKRFNMPWYYGMPFGIKGTIKWLQDITGIIGINFNKTLIADELKKHGETMGVYTSFLRPFDKLRIGISGSNEYVRGLTEYLNDECEMNVELAVIKESASKDTTLKQLKEAGISEVLVNPDVNELKNKIEDNKLHIFFGNTYELKAVAKVPIKIHSAFPCFDYVNFHDGTPFVGFKGNMYLVQTLVNNVNQHSEVWRI